MAWTAIASTQTDADSPIDQTLTDAIRTNLDDLNTRVSALAAISLQDIRDHFAASAIDGDAWNTAINGAGVAPAITVAGHYVTLDSGNAQATSWSLMYGTTKRMRIILTDYQSVSVYIRVKQSSWGTFAVGLQDLAIAGAATQPSDWSDFIGVVNGSTTGTWRANVKKASAGLLTSDFGTATNWTEFLFTVVKTASTLTVDATADGAAISGFPVSSNVPDTATLLPAIGCVGDGSNTSTYRVDTFDAYWNAIPESA